MDRLLSMRVFRQVATDGGFSQAARTLDLSAAVVTRLVADLEAHLGTRLIQRTTRRMVLTEAGRLYLDRVGPILDAVDEAERIAGAQTDEVKGLLRIHAPPVLAVHVLAPVIAGFRLRYPQVVLDIDVDAPNVLPVEQFDITLMGAPQGFDANIVARPIIHSQGWLLASPDYIRRKGLPREPVDLAQHDLLRLRIPGERTSAWQLSRQQPVSGEQAQAGIRPDGQTGGDTVSADGRVVLWANHTDTLLRAVLDGAGITGLAVELAMPHIQSGELVRVLPDWVTGRYTLYAALPSRRFIPRRTQVFLDHLTEQTRLAVAQAGG